MELIMNIIAYGKALFEVLFAVPILGILVLLSTFAPMIVKAANTDKRSGALKAHFQRVGYYIPW